MVPPLVLSHGRSGRDPGPEDCGPRREDLRPRYLADLDLDGLLARIVEIAGDLVDARYAALGILGVRSEPGLRTFVTHGMSPAEVRDIGALPTGHGLLGLIIECPEPLRLHDFADHPASYGFPPNHPPMSSFLGVPVRIRDKVFGNLYLTEKAGGGACVGAGGRSAQRERMRGRADDEQVERRLGVRVEDPRTRGVLAGLLQVAAVVWSPLQELLGTVAVTPSQVAALLALSAVPGLALALRRRMVGAVSPS